MANSVQLYRLLEANDFAGLETLFHAFFASILMSGTPTTTSPILRLLRQRVLFLFRGPGSQYHGRGQQQPWRVDMAVHFNDNIYLFEFKVVELASDGAAMAQLQAKDTRTISGLDQPIHLIAVEFSKNTRNITAFEVVCA